MRTLDRRIGGFSRLIERIKAWLSVAHLLRAAERFNDRLGSQFGAAITYFHSSPLILTDDVFAAAGFVLASNPDLLAHLINRSSAASAIRRWPAR